MDIFVDKRIRNFSMVLLLIACVMFGLFGYFAYLEGKEVQLNNFVEVGSHYISFAERSYSNIVRIGTNISEIIASNELTGDYIKDSYDTGIWFRLRKFMFESSDKIPGYKSVLVIPKTLPHLAIGLPEGIEDRDVDIEDEFFETNRRYISPVTTFLGIEEFHIITPVYLNDEIKGYVYLTMTLDDYLFDIIQTTRFKETGHMFMVNSKGEMIFHPDQMSFQIEDEFPVDFLKEQNKAIADGDRFYYVREYDISTSEEDNLYFVYTQLEEELFEFNKELRNTTFLMILAFVSLFGILAILSGKRFSRLINEDTKMVVEETLDYEIEKQTRRLKRIAETDSLTQLYNHGSVFKIIEKEIEMSEITKEPLTLMMLDLDYFKEVNDTYGHPIGDEVLIKVAEMLKENIRDIDIAGRYGGEEFTILLKNTHLDKGYVIAERIRKTILGTVFTSEKIKLTISIGIAEWSGDDVASFIKKADKKLYASKAYGRNKTTF